MRINEDGTAVSVPDPLYVDVTWTRHNCFSDVKYFYCTLGSCMLARYIVREMIRTLQVGMSNSNTIW
jgi:hypothetical protein